MPVLEKAFNMVRSAAAFSGVNGQIDMRGLPTLSGQRVDEEGSLRVAAIWIANTVLADEVASLVLRIVRRDDKTRTPLQPPELRALWSDDPNDDQIRFSIDSTETLSLNLWGWSATMLGWTRSGELDVRWPINPSNASLERLEGGGLKLVSPGQGELVNRRGARPEFCYMPRYVLPGQLTPVSPVRMAAELAGLSLAYDQVAAKLTQEGFNPGAVLTFGDAVPKELAQEYSRELTRLHSGAGRTGGVAVVGGPSPKLEKWGMSMVDAEFVAQHDRVFQILMALWRVPPTVAGMVDKPSTWGTGVAEFSRGLERFTLRPIVQLRQGAYQKYVTRWVDPDLQVKYVFDSVLSASPKERAEIQRTRLMMGSTSVERILAQEDEPPFEPDETVYSQLSMATAAETRMRLAKLQADAVAAQADAVARLIAAGMPQADAWAIFGRDPATIEPIDLNLPEE